MLQQSVQWVSLDITDISGTILLTAAVLLAFFQCSVTALSSGLNVVIDTDSGADDAMAIMMMLSSKSKAQILAITCVKGNTGVENATQNVLLMLKVAKRTEIPVFMGSSQGLVFDQEEYTRFFGYDGIGDNFEKPLLNLKKESHAALALANIVMKNPGAVSVLCIGPLTNIALAIHLYPRFLLDVKEIVILGGSYKGVGNEKPGVEFNFYMDPEAADLVFSKIPEGKLVTLIPMETVKENGYPMIWRLKVLGSQESYSMRFLNDAERLAFPKYGSSWEPFDQTAAAVLLDPTIATGHMNARIGVETCGQRARGASFVDSKSNSSNARIITTLDKQRLPAMLLAHLSS